MQRRLVLVDAGKSRHRRVLEDIVGIVVVDGRDLGDEDIGTLAPEGVSVAGHQRHAFAGQ